MKYNLFIGRWQPFHSGHKYIIDSFVNNNKPVCIAIRDTSIDQNNPFSTETRLKLISQIYKDKENVKIIIIPDIESVCVSRKVGYSIIEVPNNIKNISGTKIRESNETLDIGQNGLCIWFTGLPCSGKTTLAKELKNKLNNYIVQHLDGDEIRKTISKNLSFSGADRIENINRIGDIVKILTEKNIITICSFISPYQIMRDNLRNKIKNYFEIYVKCNIDECKKRDVKGMWIKAEKGIIKNFTGQDDLFEEPKNPDLIIETDKYNINECIEMIYNKIKKKLN